MSIVEPVPMRAPVLEETRTGLLHRTYVRFLNTLRTLLSRTSVQVGATAITAQSATISTTAVATPELQNVLTRVSYSLRITRAATTSSSATLTLGWTTDSVSCTQAFAAVTGNTTGTQQSGTIVIFPDVATSVTYAVVYASAGATTMQYALDVRVEALP